MNSTDELIQQIKDEFGVTLRYDFLAGGKYPVWSVVSLAERIDDFPGLVSLIPHNSGAVDSLTFIAYYVERIHRQIEPRHSNATRFLHEHTEANIQEFKVLFQEHLDVCRALGVVKYGRLQDHLCQLTETDRQRFITLDQFKEYDLMALIKRQENGRGVDPLAPTSDFRNKYDQYTTANHNLNDNLLFTVVADYNRGFAIQRPDGVAPILCDDELLKEFPKDLPKLAELYAQLIHDRLIEHPQRQEDIELQENVLRRMSAFFGKEF